MRSVIGSADQVKGGSEKLYRFADFTLDTRRGCLRRGGSDIPLRPRSFDVLRYLAEHPQRLVTKDELIAAVWLPSIVTDGALVQCVMDLRRSLGDQSQQLIRTVPKRGYVFECEVSTADDERRLRAPSSDASPLHRSYWSLGNAIAAVGLMLSLVVAVWIDGGFQQPSATDHPYPDGFADILIEPFRNLSGDPQIDDFAASLAGNIGFELDKANRIRVIEQSNADSPVGLPASDYSVRADLSKVRNELRILIKLIRLSDQQVVWSATHAVPLAEATASAQEHAQRIAPMIRAMQTVDFLSHFLATEDPIAKRHYLSAHKQATRQHLGAEHNNWSPIVRGYQRAIRRDPDFVQPYWMLASAYAQRLGMTVPADLALQEARNLMDQAVKLAPDDPITLILLGDIQKDLELDYAGASASYEKALELGALAPLIDYHLGTIALRMGRFEDAIDRFDAALNAGAGTNHLAAMWYKGQALTLLGDEDGALSVLNNALAAAAGAGNITQLLLREKAEVLARLGQLEEADRCLQRAWDLGRSRRPELFTSAFAQLGRVPEARRLLADIDGRFERGETVLAWQAFEANYYLGDYQRSAEWLSRAIEDRQVWLFPRLRSGRYPAVREARWFQAALRRLATMESLPSRVESSG